MENRKLEKETMEKEFKKYITYYFIKKNESKSLSKKKKENDNRLKEKAERLEEIEKINKERRIELVNKMNRMDEKRREYSKLKEERILEEKMRREEKNRNLRNRIDEMDKEESERRRDVLEYQKEILSRNSLNRTNMNIKKNNLGFNSISNQIALKNSVGIFNKKLNFLKSQSVSKKTLEERVKIYKELKIRETERKKYEKEEELYNKAH